MHRYRIGVARNLQQAFEGIFEQDLTISNCNRADGDDPIGLRIQTGHFGVQDDKPDFMDRRFIAPCVLKAISISSDERRYRHRVSSHFESAVNSNNWCTERNTLLSICRSCRLNSVGGSSAPSVFWLIPT